MKKVPEQPCPEPVFSGALLLEASLAAHRFYSTIEGKTTPLKLAYFKKNCC